MGEFPTGGHTAAEAAHADTIRSSLLSRSTDIAAANTTAGAVNGQPPTDPTKFTAWKAAILAADKAHLQRIVASGLTNGINVNNAQVALNSSTLSTGL